MSLKAHATPDNRTWQAVRLLVLLLLLAGTVGGADPPAAADQPPTQIDADHMEYDLPSRTAVFTGNVHVFDDAMDMRSERMDVAFDEANQVRQVDATGTVTIVRAKQQATARTASYNVVSGEVVLAGDPRLQQPQGEVSGAEKMVYSTADQRFRTDGGRPHLKVEAKVDVGKLDMLGGGPVPTAPATPAAAKPPTDIVADVMSYSVADRVAIFSGDVRILDQDFSVQADKITVHYGDAGDIERIVAEGKVQILRADGKATADRAVYDIAAGEIHLTGSPELLQGTTRISGMEWVNYVKSAGKYSFGGGRVRTQIVTGTDGGALLEALPGGDKQAK